MGEVMESLAPIPGASDKDRPAWLVERRTGVTATEIRDLYLGKLTIPRLVNLKLGRETDSFSGNAYTNWGNERETVIAAQLERQFGIRPESRVFHAADAWRYLASPDGVGEDFDGRMEVSEIKTAGKDIAPGAPAFVEKGYYVQMVWAMRVMGAHRCLYAWEERINIPYGVGTVGQVFVPGQLRIRWIEFDEAAEALVVKLEKIADDFLAALDAAAAEPFTGPVIDEEIDTLAVNYLRGLEMEKEATDLKEPAYRRMFELLDAGEPVVQESPLARVSFTPAVVEDRPVEVVDADAARAAAPELYARLDLALAEATSAAEAVEVELAAVRAHEVKFTAVSGTEPVVVKKASLRVTTGKDSRG